MSCKAPPNKTDMGLMPVWDGEPIEFHTEVDYKCEDFGKFEKDFEAESINATCKPDNTWAEPDWPQCLHSKSRSLVRVAC